MPSEVIESQEEARDGDMVPRAGHARSMILVRHGRTSYNLAERIQGGVDIPLDQVGIWQVHETAHALKALYVDGHPHVGQLVVSSDLGRAMQTAHAFADQLGLAVHPDKRMRERNFGAWEGKSSGELSNQFPDDYHSWGQLQGGELKHGAETKHHVGQRGVEGLEHWSAQAGPKTDLFVFAHGAWIAQTVQTLLGFDEIGGEPAGLTSMRNAHWARLVPLDRDDGTVLWRLMDYNHGPSLADTPQWESPRL